MSFDVTQPAYLALREAALPDIHRLVIWCGAGLSRPAGIPSWTGLRQALEKNLRSHARQLGDRDRRSLEKRLDYFQGETNPWVAFGFIQRQLGPTTYRETIREHLSAGSTASIPPAYLKLWQLRVAGMVNLNLDPLALRAHSEIHPGKRIVPFTGNNIGTHTHVLHNPNTPFLCHLHGQDTDVSTWVFTHDELSALMKSEPYHDFIRSILTSFTVLFIGLSADDVAVGSHLESMVNKGTDFGAHYWVTDRNTRETERWAEAASIRTIYYRVTGNEHSELEQMIDELIQYVPHDDGARVYPPALHGSSLTPVQTLPPPEQVRTLSPDEIRRVLNSKALDILRADNPNRDRDFAEFVEEYDYEIHSAWYVSTTEGRNALVGYKLKEYRTKGAFGQIFKAEDAAGNPVAIKLLKDEVRTDQRLLQSFRRGVQAMHILSQHDVTGMVPYKETSEIPAFVAMDWIDGYDLRQAVKMGLLDSWESLIHVALRIASILKEAHSLPERVLHRDLRPANIMLKQQPDKGPWDVFLLDFDLSWYLGSVEQSVVHGSDAYGYLAPEQIHREPGASSRHPAVDSYGLGMTFFFAISGTDPSPNQHLHATWRSDVLNFASRRRRAVWVSVAKRFARLVLSLTQGRQSMRWDLAQVVLELERLRDVLQLPNKVRFADMLAEEVAARSSTFSDYVWDRDAQAAVLAVRPAGISMALAGDDGKHQIELRLSRIRSEGDERWKGAKRMIEASRNIQEILRSGGWFVDLNTADNDVILISARIGIENVMSSIDKTAALIDRVEDALPRM